MNDTLVVLAGHVSRVVRYDESVGTKRDLETLKELERRRRLAAELLRQGVRPAEIARVVESTHIGVRGPTIEQSRPAVHPDAAAPPLAVGAAPAPSAFPDLVWYPRSRRISPLEIRGPQAPPRVSFIDKSVIHLRNRHPFTELSFIYGL